MQDQDPSIGSLRFVVTARMALSLATTVVLAAGAVIAGTHALYVGALDVRLGDLEKKFAATATAVLAEQARELRSETLEEVRALGSQLKEQVSTSTKIAVTDATSGLKDHLVGIGPKLESVQESQKSISERVGVLSTRVTALEGQVKRSTERQPLQIATAMVVGLEALNRSQKVAYEERFWFSKSRTRPGGLDVKVMPWVADGSNDPIAYEAGNFPTGRGTKKQAAREVIKRARAGEQGITDAVKDARAYLGTLPDTEERTNLLARVTAVSSESRQRYERLGKAQIL